MAKQVRAARHYQRDDDPVLRLSRSAMRGVARELKHAFNNLSSMVPVKSVAEAIRNGRDPKGLINWHHYREVLRGAFDRLGKLRHAGGALGARKINGAFAAKRRKVRFRKAGYTHFTSEGAVLGATKFAATRKASKAEAGYEDRSSHGVSCSECWMFQAVWQCCAVEGVINPNGWCTYWETVFAKAYNPDEPRDERGRWTSGGAGSDPSREDIPAEEGYAYHATNEENLRDIVESGRLVTHGPSFGTDQSEWPDGSREKRSYWTSQPNVARSFYPGGHPVLLRVARADIGLKRESTGDLYSTKPVGIGSIDVYVGDGKWQRLRIAKSFTKATGDQFNFDSFSPAVQAAARAEQDRLIRQLETDARDTIDAIISAGLSDGTSVDDMAANIADNIGLTETQWNAVDNYRNMLEELDPDSLVRRLRNTEYDAVVQDAIDAQTDLSETAIENMVSDYVENYIDYRAATIAQTESTRAANLGLHDAYDQAIERGALTDEAVTRIWQLGDNPCPVCESIVDNNPDGVGVNESFDSLDGPIDDPPVHPNCECSVDYVTDLNQVPDDGEEQDIGPGSFGVGGVDTPYMDDGGDE